MQLYTIVGVLLFLAMTVSCYQTDEDELQIREVRQSGYYVVNFKY